MLDITPKKDRKLKVLALCQLCHGRKAVMKRPKNLQKLCKECFFVVFEKEIHNTITAAGLFHPGEKVAIGASGGKDSTVLASILKTLNERYNYGLKLVLLSIDEGIKGYRDDSLATVKRNQQQYEMELEIVSYKELYNWLMDEIVSCAGIRSSCTYCGVLRRQALDRGAAKLGIHHVVTGHNADDMAETVLMNILRGDTARLESSCTILTQSAGSPIKRSKPFKYTYQKEIVLYAHYKKLDYFSTECTYAPEAFRGTARELLKGLGTIRPSCIMDIIYSGEHLVLAPKKKVTKKYKNAGKPKAGHKTAEITPAHPENEQQINADGSVSLGRAKTTDGNTCEKCGYITSNRVCKACILLAGLEMNRAKVSVDSPADGAAKLGKTLEQLSF
ncbi:tRNA 2-thiolation protein 1 [Metschnikowia aff. pulcherrima]|uniref:Cytoplasmic tRNA 2-thiolation protein 1 n=1 Tax=Metschnikowia aff. pulcherrima TaxID=2163413 RepID=A0A4P6XKK7_9ASCO|nr:tRNA 2-thiolation protein 1 [Metschnikowia aff. pulcherrima]